MTVNGGLDVERKLIAAVRPDLAAAALEEVGVGLDARVVVAGDAVVRFPRHAEAARRLEREPGVLALVAAHAPLRVPPPTLHRGPHGIFSERAKIAGSTIDPATYHAFDDEARELLAADLAATYAALHRIEPDLAREAGAVPIGDCAAAEDIFAALGGLLDPPLLGAAARILSVAATLPDDEIVFGHFATHGANMAIDPASGRLAALSDFGDAGIGALHRDLSFLCFVSADLAARVLRRYAGLSRRRVVLERVFTLHAALLLARIAEAAEDGRVRAVWMLTDWLAALSRFRGESLAQASPSHHRRGALAGV